MGTLDVEEATLKKKLDDADSLEERREIRKQLRDLRNRKFEEEVKKVTAGDYKPNGGTITNGTDSISSRFSKSERPKRQESLDDYGLSIITDEDQLQTLLNDTPFTETDKRRKIRARLREVRNQQLGIGEPAVVTKKSKIEREPEKITAEPLQSSASTRVEKDVDSGYKSRLNREEKVAEDDYKSRSYREEKVVEDGYKSRSYREEKVVADSYRNRSTREENIVEDGYRSRATREEKVVESSYKSRHVEEIALPSEDKEYIDNSKTNEDDGTSSISSHADMETEQNDVIEDENQDNREEDEEVSSEGNSEDDASNKADDDGEVDDEDDGDVVEDAAADVDSDQEDDSENEAEAAVDQQSDGEGDVEEDGEQESDTPERDEDDEYDGKDQPMRDDVSEHSEKSYESDEEKRSRNESEDVKAEDKDNELDDMEEEEPLHDDIKKDRDDEVKYQDDEEEEIFDEDEKDSQKDDNNDYLEDSVYREERRGSYRSVDSASSADRERSDSNVSSASEISSTSKGTGSRSAGVSKTGVYVEDILRAKEPGIQDGKGFKEKLKKSNSNKLFEKKEKVDAEQQDFRTVLKSTEKPKYFGDRPVGPAEQLDFRDKLKTSDKAKKDLADKRQKSIEQLDFRNLLSETGEVLTRKVPTQAEQIDFRSPEFDAAKSMKKSLADKKQLSVEQKDFRTVLSNTGLEVTARKTSSQAEQIDFRSTNFDAASKIKNSLTDKRQKSVEQLDFRNLLSETGEVVAPRKVPTQAEQVDFRKSGFDSAKSIKKGLADKKQLSVEQKDFRTLLSETGEVVPPRKVPTQAEQIDFRKSGFDSAKSIKKGLADKKQLSVEQKDFRTVLSKTGGEVSSPKVPSQGEQVDFRSSLKKKRTPPMSEKENMSNNNSSGEINFKDNLKKTNSIPQTENTAEKEREVKKRLGRGKSDKKPKSDSNAEEDSKIESDITAESESKKAPDGPTPKPKPKANKQEKEETVSVKEDIKPVEDESVKEEREVQAEPVLEEEKATVEVEQKQKSSSLGRLSGRSTARVEQKSSSLGRASKLDAKLKELESKSKVSKLKENRFLKKDVGGKEKAAPESKFGDRNKLRSRRFEDAQVNSKITDKKTVEPIKPVETVKPDEQEATKTKPRSRRVIRTEDEDTDSSANKEEKTNEVVVGKDEADGSILSKVKEREQEQKTVPKSKPIGSKKPVERVSSKSEQEQPEKKGDDSEDEAIGQRRNRTLAKRLENSANETLKFLEDIENKKKGRTAGSTNVAESKKINEPKTVGRKIPPKVEKPFVSSKENKISNDVKIKENEKESEKKKEPEKKEPEKKEPEEKKEEETTDDKKSDAAKTKEDATKARKERMAALEARMAERRRARAAENRKKAKSASEGRNLFKKQLDKNAPKGDASKIQIDTNMNRLLIWTQQLTSGYPGVDVQDFSSSWADGLAFCALMHNFVPNKIEFNKLTKENQQENFELAFSVATDEGVPELLEVEDMVRMRSPDPKSLITYLHSIYQVMVHDRQ